MFIIADFIRPLERLSYRRHQRFIDQVKLIDYCIAPESTGCDRDYSLKALHGEDSFEPGLSYATKFSFPVAGKREHLRSTLSEIVRLVSFLASEPEELNRLARLDPSTDDATILTEFSIDYKKHCRASVAAWTNNLFLAPHEQGYAYFLVDVHGEIIIHSKSDRLLPVAFHFFADREIERTRLLSRIAQMAPAPESGL